MSASLKTTLTDLPEEMVLNIFKLLPPKDIKSVMLVCKESIVFAENPVLWSWSFDRHQARFPEIENAKDSFLK